MLDDIRTFVPDLYLSLLLTPSAQRQQLLPLYALEAELLKIPSRVSQPVLGLMRVTWWRDALQKQDVAQPLLADLHKNFPQSAQQLADFAESFGVLFEEITDEDKARILKARAMVWASMVAPILGVPVPDAYAAAAWRYEVQDNSAALSTPPSKPLKILARLAKRRLQGKTSWLGDVFTALLTSVY